MTLLRADQSPVTAAALFGKIARTGPPSGVALPGHAAQVQLTARLGPASLGLAPVTVNVSVQDADNNVYQLDAGLLPADGRDHTLTVTLANQAAGPGSGHLPAAADLGQPGLHAARPEGSRTGHLHRRELLGGAGDDPGARYGAAAPGPPRARRRSWPAPARPPARPGRRACPR